MRRHAVAVCALLVVNVLLRLDPPELLIYADPAEQVTSPDAYAAQQGCPYLRRAEIPLPVPYTIQELRSRAGGAQTPDPDHRRSGLVSACPTESAAAAAPSP